MIEGRLGRGMLGKSIWQDLVEQEGFRGSYDSVKCFVRKIRKRLPEVFAVIPTEPGLEAQVDYGRGAPTKCPVSEKYKRPWLFSMKLSHSRKAFRKAVWKSSSEIWCQLHEEAFRHFGGTPRTIKLDNLKEGVLKPDLYDPQLNPLYETFLKHYGVVALPCRVATPRHKGKVESDIKYAQNALKGRSFETIEEQNGFLVRWDERWANTRIHGTIKRQVKEIFESEEKPALQALPIQSFPLVKICKRKVHIDGHILIDNAFYSAPAAWVGQEITAHVGLLFVDLIDPKTGERLARHTPARQGHYRTDQNHLPDRKRNDRLHQHLIARAKTVGLATETLVTHILNERPYHAIRAAQGVLSFLRKHRKESLEEAAKLCIDKNIRSYRALKNILARKEEPLKTETPLTQQHDLIRPVEVYRTLWDRHLQ